MTPKHCFILFSELNPYKRGIYKCGIKGNIVESVFFIKL